MATIIVGIIVFALIALAVYFSFRKPKNGGCRGCAHSNCHSESKKQSSEQQHCSSCHPSDSTK